VDNGYFESATLMCPSKHPDSVALREWSKSIESLRKVVECTFGILKQKWRPLKTGTFFGKPDTLDKLFRACCALHNLILEQEHGVRIFHGGQHPEHDLNVSGPYDSLSETQRKAMFRDRRAQLALHHEVFRELYGSRFPSWSLANLGRELDIDLEAVLAQAHESDVAGTVQDAANDEEEAVSAAALHVQEEAEAEDAAHDQNLALESAFVANILEQAAEEAAMDAGHYL
jgi:hypothetical protein